MCFFKRAEHSADFPLPWLNIVPSGWVVGWHCPLPNCLSIIGQISRCSAFVVQVVSGCSALYCWPLPLHPVCPMRAIKGAMLPAGAMKGSGLLMTNFSSPRAMRFSVFSASGFLRSNMLGQGRLQSIMLAAVL